MRLISIRILSAAFMVLLVLGCRPGEDAKKSEPAVSGEQQETRAQFDERMEWWREARFGLFLHWGLYAIPAGEWKGETNHAEWILQTAQIPVDEYVRFAPQFNPVEFDAADWVRMAKEAGMKYIVITSKHHDGFCLFDSEMTDFDVMDATPFKRDILKELAEECRKQGLKMCWYHSIMDWHHPDYLPRRSWENRAADDADFDRYVDYMKAQVKELITNYGEIGVLWFDGEWEKTWTPERGLDLYRYVRSLQPNIIINNRVGKGRAGMAGTYDPGSASGDFGTPEQEIPATGLDYDWETCMTMNDYWGYNRNDPNWKSETDLIQKLSDIASKGGNFLLNVGPTAEGLFPPESVERLAAIGRWMKTNGDSIYGTTASLFEKLDWGRSTTKGRTLYFHVFDWPADGRLVVPGLLTKADRAVLLSSSGEPLDMFVEDDHAVITVPAEAPDKAVSVVACTFASEPEVVRSPDIARVIPPSIPVRVLR
ncbi:MAG: alpha-L-fucosidase [Acidobacteriota bacterium]